MANMQKTDKPKTPKAPAKRSPSRWTITGVTKTTREAVERAAKKEAIPIGKWVDRTLREAAERQMQGGPPAPALPSGLLDTLNDLTQRVKALGEGSPTLQHVQETASGFGDQVSSTYDALMKRTEKAVEEVRAWTDKALDDTSKWGTEVVEQLKGSAARLQNTVANRPPQETKALPPKDDETSGPNAGNKDGTG